MMKPFRTPHQLCPRSEEEEASSDWWSKFRDGELWRGPPLEQKETHKKKRTENTKRPAMLCPFSAVCCHVRRMS